MSDSSKPTAKALFLCCAEDNAEELQSLLEQGGDPNLTEPKFKMSLLHKAAQNGSAACVSTLLKYGADPNVKTSRADSVLHFAVRAAMKKQPLNSPEHTECVRILLESNADRRVKDLTGNTPVFYAEDDSDIARLLNGPGDATVPDNDDDHNNLKVSSRSSDVSVTTNGATTDVGVEAVNAEALDVPASASSSVSASKNGKNDDEHVSALRAQLDEARTALQSLRAEHTQCQTRLSELKNYLEKERKERDRAEQLAESARKQLDAETKRRVAVEAEAAAAASAAAERVTKAETAADTARREADEERKKREKAEESACKATKAIEEERARRARAEADVVANASSSEKKHAQLYQQLQTELKQVKREHAKNVSDVKQTGAEQLRVLEQQLEATRAQLAEVRDAAMSKAQTVSAKQDEESQASLRELHARVDSLQCELDAARTAANTEAQAIVQQRDEAETARRAADVRLKSFQAEMEERRSRTESATAEVATLREKLASVRAELADTVRRNESLGDELKAAVAEKEKHVERVNELQSDAEKAAAERRRAEATASDSSAALSTAKAALEASEARAAKLDVALARTTDAEKKASEALVALNTQCAAVHADLESARAANNACSEQAESVLSTLRAELIDAKKNAAKTEVESAQLRAQLSEALEAKGTAESLVDSLQRRLEQVGADHAKERADTLASGETRIEELNAIVTDRDSKLDELRRTLTGAEARVAELEAAVAEQRDDSDVDSILGDCDDALGRALTDMQAGAPTLLRGGEMMAATMACDKLRADLDEANQRIGALESQRNELRTQLDEQQRAGTASRSTLDALIADAESALAARRQVSRETHAADEDAIGDLLLSRLDERARLAAARLDRALGDVARLRAQDAQSTGMLRELNEVNKSVLSKAELAAAKCLKIQQRFEAQRALSKKLEEKIELLEQEAELNKASSGAELERAIAERVDVVVETHARRVAELKREHVASLQLLGAELQASRDGYDSVCAELRTLQEQRATAARQRDAEEQTRMKALRERISASEAREERQRGELKRAEEQLSHVYSLYFYTLALQTKLDASRSGQLRSGAPDLDDLYMRMRKESIDINRWPEYLATALLK